MINFVCFIFNKTKINIMHCIKMNVHAFTRFFMALFLALGLVLSMPMTATAQETEEKQEEEDPWADKEFPFEDELLLTFFDTNQEVSAMQRSTQERISDLVEQYGLTRQRFDQIGRAAQMGALQDGAFSNEEIEAFNQVAPQVTQLQRENQNMIQMIIQDNDLSMNQYREILNAFRQEQELQQYVSHLARERARQKILEERRREAERKLEEERRQQEEEGN